MTRLVLTSEVGSGWDVPILPTPNLPTPDSPSPICLLPFHLLSDMTSFILSALSNIVPVLRLFFSFLLVDTNLAVLGSILAESRNLFKR